MENGSKSESAQTEVIAPVWRDWHTVGSDFRRFEGSWRVRSLPDGSSLLYELTVQGCLGMPIGLIEERLRDDLSSNLRAVEQEARRRWIRD